MSSERDTTHHDEVETVTLFSGGTLGTHSHHPIESECSCCKQHAFEDLSQGRKGVLRDSLIEGLQELSKENTWRVKGFIRFMNGNSDAPSVHILNWAFGRYDLTAVRREAVSDYLGDEEIVRLTVMGERGEVKRAARRLGERIGARVW